MTVIITDQPSWEYRLLLRAHDALEYHTPSNLINVEPDTLKSAYMHAAEITKKHSRTFYLASNLLPANQRRAAQALYAFCRISDDLVDRVSNNQQQQFDDWRQRSMVEHPAADDLAVLAWAETRSRYQIPLRYAEHLLDGVARDLVQTRYDSFADLASYCYAVASTVGLMTMHIVGYSGREAIPYAIKLGIALQLTNILRDVGEDWENGRLYLPQDELARFGLTESDIAAGTIDYRWRAFMRFQINRARRLYAEAMPGISMLGRQGQMAIAAAAELYGLILTDIENHDYDVFTRRAHVTGRGKLQKIPGIWWRTRTNQYSPAKNQDILTPWQSAMIID